MKNTLKKLAISGCIVLALAGTMVGAFAMTAKTSLPKTSGQTCGAFVVDADENFDFGRSENNDDLTDVEKDVLDSLTDPAFPVFFA